METYPITNEPTEELELQVEEVTYALVQRIKTPDGVRPKVIVMNKREVLKLYRVIEEEVQK